MKKLILSLVVLFSITLSTFAFTAGDSKVVLIVTHEVKNYTEWKAGFDAGKEFREKAGFIVTGVFTSVDNPNLVTITFDVPSVEAVKGFLSNPALKADMEKAGVISAPEIKILNKQ